MDAVLDLRPFGNGKRTVSSIPKPEECVESLPVPQPVSLLSAPSAHPLGFSEGLGADEQGCELSEIAGAPRSGKGQSQRDLAVAMAA